MWTFSLDLEEINHIFSVNFCNSPKNLEDLKDKFELVYTYFGTFSRSLLTMFEITLANWPPVCRALTENVTEPWFGLRIRSLHGLMGTFMLNRLEKQRYAIQNECIKDNIDRSIEIQQ